MGWGEVKGRAKEKLRNLILEIASHGALNASIALALPYIALLGVPSFSFEILKGVLEDRLVDALKEKLGMRKHSEKDAREIFEITKKNEEVREALFSLMEELLDDKLLKELGEVNPSAFNSLLKSLEELKKEIPGLEKKVGELEERMSRVEEEIKGIKVELEDLKKGIVPVYAKEEDLVDILRIQWIREREPVLSDKLREKVDKIVSYIEKGEKVCITGDAGVGKTTILYLACVKLLSRGFNIRISGIHGRGVYVIDNICAKRDLLKELDACITPVLASARKSDWDHRKGWTEVEIEAEDHRPKLKDMLESMLKASNVEYTKEGVYEVIKRSPTPVYLSSLSEWLRERGRRLDRDTAREVPPGIYEFIAKVIMDCDDDLAVALLYCTASTKTGRLHRAQLDILRDMLKKRISGFEGDGRYEGLLAEFDGSYGIKHDVWRDLITMDRERVPEDILSSVEKMDAIKRIKEYDVEELTREACKESLNHIKDMKAIPAAELVKRALENFPDLSEYAFKIALEAREDKRDLILDVIAAEAPEPLMRIEIDEAEKLAYEIEEAPSAGVVLFSRLSSHYRNLAEKDERYLPDFAKALSNLGIALCDKGMIDEAIDKHNEALKIYRNLASEDEGYLPYLARALANLGNALSDKGIQDEAINKYNESLKIYRALVSKDKQYLPDLARTLNILGLTLLYKGAQDEAIDNFNEALKIYRTLAREDEKYLSDLAAVLVNLGNALSDEGMIDEAINKYNESLKIYRTLAVKDERHLPSLMAVLNNIGDSLSNKGLQDEAIDKYNEAFRICKTLVSRDERYLPVLAVILNNLGTALYGKGMIDEAIDKHNEALKVLEPLSDRPWIWDLMSRCHIRIAHSLISKENKKDAVEHLCRALELLTDERALKTFYSESTLADCVKFLEEIEEELIPEECKRKLKALREHQ